MSAIKPKEQLHNLLTLITKKQLVNNRFVFFLPEAKRIDAEKYVHRMRVELSRLRNLLRQKGLQKRNFKLLLDEIIELPQGCDITLRFKDDSTIEFAQDLIAQLSALTNGVPIEPATPRQTHIPIQENNNSLRNFHVKVS